MAVCYPGCLKIFECFPWFAVLVCRKVDDLQDKLRICRKSEDLRWIVGTFEGLQDLK